MDPTTTSLLSPEESTKRAWNPNAPAILWAHELRRENVQLVNQMDSLGNILKSTANSIESLNRSVELITERLDRLEVQQKDGEQQFQQFEDRQVAQGDEFNRRLQHLQVQVRSASVGGGGGMSPSASMNSLSAKLSELELENGKLRGCLFTTDTSLADLREAYRFLGKEVKERVSALGNATEMTVSKVEQFEKGSGVLSERVSVVEGEHSDLKKEVEKISKVLGTVKAVVIEGIERGSGTTGSHPRHPTPGARATRSRPEATPTPTSAPRENTRTLRRSSSNHSTQELGQGISARTPSQTTLDSQSDLDLDPAQARHEKDTETVLREFRQGSQTLYQYLSSVNDLRTSIPSVTDTRLVGSFLFGLKTAGLGNRIRQRMNHLYGEDSWEGLVSVVMKMVNCEGAEGGDGLMPMDSRAEIPAVAAPAAEVRPQETKRKRRAIPIVAPDEEDALIAAGGVGSRGR